MRTFSTTITLTSATAIIAALAFFPGCHRQPDPTLGTEMRHAYSATSELYGYVWNPDQFLDPKYEKKISRLIAQLSGDFHRIESKAPIEMFEPGFTVTLASQQQLLADIGKRFNQGSKEYAQWRLQSVSQNCIACHSRFNAPVDFLGSSPQPVHGDGSFEAQSAMAKYLFATRQFDQAATKLFTLARSVGKLESGRNRAFQSLQLWLAIEVRVKSRYAKAASELSKIRGELNLSDDQSEAVGSWVNELKELDAQQKTAGDLTRAQILLQPVMENESIKDDNFHLVSTLRASSILHTLLLAKDSPSNQRAATFLLAVSYTHLPIPAFEGFPLLYLEQCIRAYPESSEAQKAFNFYEDILKSESTGSAGLQLDREDQRKLNELRHLAYGSSEQLNEGPLAAGSLSLLQK